MSKFCCTFAPAFEKKVLRSKNTAGWMSDLVNGLQNRLERFDSATGLTEKSLGKGDFSLLKNRRFG